MAPKFNGLCNKSEEDLALCQIRTLGAAVV